MSHHLVIATVTETLAQIVRDAVQPLVPGVEVTTGVPGREEQTGAARVNIVLYQTLPNAAFRNARTPAAPGADAAPTRHQLALHLNYLVSFHGAVERLVAQQLLALTVMAFHANATIGREHIQRAITAAHSGYLDGSDLAEQQPIITLSALGLSLDELVKVCALTQQAPFAPAIAYQCSVVLRGG